MPLPAERESAGSDRYREYWRENLERWAGLYSADASDGHLENLRASPLLAQIYRRTITPIERRLLHTRLELCRAFIREHVSAGQTASDVGCGTGVLTTELLAQGASVIAIDFIEEALDATRRRVEATRPDDAHRVRYVRLDVRSTAAPRSDVTIAIGVAPYVTNIAAFVSNVTAQASTSYCHYIDALNWANRVRRVLPMLNVRSLCYTTTRSVEAEYARTGLVLVKRDRLGTGFLDVTRRR